jgi:hypothetical protein
MLDPDNTWSKYEYYNGNLVQDKEETSSTNILAKEVESSTSLKVKDPLGLFV